MKKNIYFTILIGILFFFGQAPISEAGCLMSCEEDSSEAYLEDDEELPNEDAQKDERTQHFGNLRDSVVVSGVEMNTSNKVTVGGSNSGDINTTSSTIIMGVNKSHNNTNNTTTTSNR